MIIKTDNFKIDKIYSERVMNMPTSIPTYTVTIEILQYLKTETAEALTDSSSLKITDHGLNDNDFIINTTRRVTTQMLAERGSRKVDAPSSNTLNLIHENIIGQQSGDTIMLFKFQDKTSYLLDGTLSINDLAGGNSDCTFSMRQLPIQVGQYVKIKVDSVLRFAGVITDFTHTKVQNSVDEHIFNINCTGFNHIPSRRTIPLDFDAGRTSSGTSSGIVEEMIDSYLNGEGVEHGEIAEGIVFEEEWKGDIISITDVLDECAARNGFQWNIDKEMKLNFYKDATTVSECTYTLETGGTFTDYRDISVVESIDNYVNKPYVVGGNDDHGDVIWTMNGSLSEQNSMQDRCGGTGVYGNVYRDSEIVNHDYIVAEASSTTTQLNITGHPFTIGDYFWNVSRGRYGRGYVTEVVSTVSVMTTPVTNQTAGDTIEVYYDANLVGKEIFRKQGNIPQTVEFKSYHMEFYPQTKLTISVSDMSLSGTYNIDEVNITDRGAHYFETTVKAVLRNDDDFSTHKKLDYKDYFRGF